jgi:hypothetical protein
MFDFALLHEKRVVGNVIAESVHAWSDNYGTYSFGLVA